MKQTLAVGVAKALAKGVRDDNGCLVHPPRGLSKGYAQASYYDPETGRWRHAPVHRVLAEWRHGAPLDPKAHVDHLCENKACMEVEHTEVVTAAENIARFQYRNNRRLRTQCPQGHPYDEANTYVDPTRGFRYCRACWRLRAEQRKEHARASA